MGSAVSTGVSVVGGLVGLSNQSSSAKAQRKAIEAQSEQQALEAQLKLYELDQTRQLNELTDAVNDQITAYNYQQAEASIVAQQKINELNTKNAIFEAQVAQQQAEINRGITENQIEEQRIAQDKAALENSINQLRGLGDQQSQNAATLIEQLSKEGSNFKQIANILDVAMSSGGVNEALTILFGEYSNADAEFAKDEQLRQAQASLISDIEKANLATNKASADVSQGQNEINTLTQIEQAKRAEKDAALSLDIANTSYDTQLTSLKAQKELEDITTPLERQMRDDLAEQQESALLQGAAIQSDIAKAQVKGINSPGFLDVLGVGLNGYQTYTKTSK